MESKNYAIIAISLILAFVLITATATGISTTSFKNVLAQVENGSLQDENIGMSQEGMSQDQTSESESTAFNPE